MVIRLFSEDTDSLRQFAWDKPIRRWPGDWIALTSRVLGRRVLLSLLPRAVPLYETDTKMVLSYQHMKQCCKGSLSPDLAYAVGLGDVGSRTTKNSRLLNPGLLNPGSFVLMTKTVKPCDQEIL